MAKEETKKTSTKKAEVKKDTKKASTKKTTTKKTAAKSTRNTQAQKENTAKKVAATPKKESKAKTSIVQEENHYGRTLLAAILIIIVVVGGYLAVEWKKNGGIKPKEKYVATADEKAFKEEYESLNGTTRSNGQINKEISILEDNNIKYITVSEAATMLDSGSGIIYFGFSACPWCRNAVPVLLNAMNSSELDTIYYVNVRPDDDANKDIRDSFILDSRNKAKKSKDAEKAYYDILLALANELNDYVLKTDSGKTINIGEKRLSAPTVVAVKDGVVVGFHAGTVSNHVKDEDGKLRDLTKDEETELLNTYASIIGKYLNTDCGADTEGC
ncbi:MAG: hypothetical protein K2H20_00880 [Bacilli bacterium]|nr:hypothetical protein [Bacilli bacterium]